MNDWVVIHLLDGSWRLCCTRWGPGPVSPPSRDEVEKLIAAKLREERAAPGLVPH